MIKLSCKSKGLGHRYQNKFLFRNMDFTAESGKVTFITGSNGSGKSTLLKLLTGALQPLEGAIQHFEEDKEISAELVWNKIGFVAPYQELPEDFSMEELIGFQKSLNENSSAAGYYKDLVALFGMEDDYRKLIRYFSTGMKQKAKFILNLGDDRPFWFLDEPTSNLDLVSSLRFWDFINAMKANKVIIVASNDPAEFRHSEQTIQL